MYVPSYSRCANVYCVCTAYTNEIVGRFETFVIKTIYEAVVFRSFGGRASLRHDNGIDHLREAGEQCAEGDLRHVVEQPGGRCQAIGFFLLELNQRIPVL